MVSAVDVWVLLHFIFFAMAKQPHYALSLLGLLALTTCLNYVFNRSSSGDVSEYQLKNVTLSIVHPSHPQHTPFSYDKFASLDDFLVDGHLPAMTADHPKDLVVVFVDNSYLETFGVWLDHYKQHDNSKRILCAIAMSSHAYEQLHYVFTLPIPQETYGNLGETILVNFHSGLNAKVKLKSLWVERLKSLRRIIYAYPTLNVLFTDADAIWLKDPARLYNHPQHLSSDIVASKGTFPKGCPLGREDNGAGATICFGFAYFRNTPAVRILALNMEKNAHNYDNDDQKTINCVLNKRFIPNATTNIDDKLSPMGPYTLDDGSFVRSFNNFEEDGVIKHSLKVSMLPYHQVIRHCDHSLNSTGVTIAHCASDKSGHAKMDVFARYGFLTQGESSLRHFFAEGQRLPVPSPALVSMKGAAYNISVDRFWRRVKSITPEGGNILEFYYPDLLTQHQSNGGIIMKNTRLLNSIRIPKSGSSALSAIARGLAGCHPDGYPCCKFPGNPAGSCPRKDLMCPLVTGCTDHYPNFNGNETIVTSLRNPVKRSVSAFFYAPPHTSVKKGQPHTWEKFIENIQNPKYRNVLTKMLNGAYAYSSFDGSKHTVPNAKSRLCSIAWFGLSEMPVASHMTLYETHDFRQLKPNPVTFGVHVPAKDSKALEENTDGLRVNDNPEYKNFLSTLFGPNDGASLVADHNKEDIELFHFAKCLFCARLFSMAGLVDEMKHANLGINEIEECAILLGGYGSVELPC